MATKIGSESDIAQYSTLSSPAGEILIDPTALHELITQLIDENKAPIPFKKEKLQFERPMRADPKLIVEDPKTTLPWDRRILYDASTQAIVLNQTRIWEKYKPTASPQSLYRELLESYYRHVFITRNPEATQQILEQQKLTVNLLRTILLLLPLVITTGTGIANHEAASRIVGKDISMFVIGLIVFFGLYLACDGFLARLVDEPYRFAKDNQDDERLAKIVTLKPNPVVTPPKP